MPRSVQKEFALALGARGLGGGVRRPGLYPPKVEMFEPKATRALAPAGVRFLKIGNLGNGPFGFLGRGRIGKGNPRLDHFGRRLRWPESLPVLVDRLMAYLHSELITDNLGEFS